MPWLAGCLRISNRLSFASQILKSYRTLGHCFLDTSKKQCLYEQRKNRYPAALPLSLRFTREQYSEMVSH
jgi:hypothetical protein